MRGWLWAIFGLAVVGLLIWLTSRRPWPTAAEDAVTDSLIASQEKFKHETDSVLTMIEHARDSVQGF